MFSFLSAFTNRYTATALLALAVLFAWTLDRRLQFNRGEAQGRAHVMQAWQAAQAQAKANLRQQERDLQRQVTEAQNARTTAQTTINANHRATADAVSRLRQQLENARVRARDTCSNNQTQAPDPHTADELQRTLAAAVGSLADEGAAIAAAADGHVADVLLLENVP